MPIWKAPELTAAGRLIKTHGYQGALRLSSDIDGLEELPLPGLFCFIIRDSRPVPFEILDISILGTDYKIILRGIDNEKTAKQLIGLDIYLESEMLAEDDTEDEIDALLDCQVYLKDTGEQVGFVSDMIENGPQWLMEVTHRGVAKLIPFVDEIVLQIDTEAKRIIIDPPIGLLDLE